MAKKDITVPRYKQLSNIFRYASSGVDFLDVLPFLNEASAAALCAFAATIDVTANLAMGKYKKAGQEAVEGAAETLVTLIPFVEYLRGVGINFKQIARDHAGRWYVRKFGTDELQPSRLALTDPV
jgi:hypothetical protein